MITMRILARPLLALACVSALGLAACSNSQYASPQSAAQSAETSTSASYPSTASSDATTSATTEAPAPTVDVRAAAASLMMVGVRDFDDALWALNQGAGGIFIGSDTNPELLNVPGRDIATLRAQVAHPFQVSIDFEGGRVLRFPEILGNFPSPQVMAQTMSPDQVRGMAFDMGTSLAQHGVTVNFAPVLDVDGANLDVVGDRSFSDDPAVAGSYAASFAQGMLDAGVKPVFKHFPGHGRASGDSHTGQVVTPPLADVEQFDLVPYNTALSVTGAGVMVGHMVVPGLGEYLPSSLNPAAYQLLRSGSYPGGRPFDGVVYTDDLSGMKAVSDLMPPQQAAITALEAGADQALWISTAGLDEAIDGVVAAVNSGQYPREQFDRSVARVKLQFA